MTPDVPSHQDDPFIRHLRDAGIRFPQGATHGPPPRPPRALLVTIAIVAALFLLVPAITSRLADWLWFREIGFERVFLTQIGAQWAIGASAALVAFAVLYGNARFAMRGLDPSPTPPHDYISGVGGLEPRVRAGLERGVRLLSLPWAALLTVFVALAMAGAWKTALLALYRTPFGRVDPVFGRDVSYYVFVLPAIETLVGFAYSLLILSLLFIALPIHLVRAEVGRIGNRLVIRPRAQAHLALLAGLLLLVTAIRIHFVRVPGLLFGDHLPLSGANFVDLHVRLPALRLLSIAALGGALLIGWGGLRGRLVPTAVRVVIVYIAIALLGSLVPSAYQRLVVQANELARETPQIAHHIAATRAAWGIDSVVERELRTSTTLTPEVIAANRPTIDNVRVWDREPLLQTFGQIQSIRTYYDFINVDDDRYLLGNQLRQVMLSAREMNTDALPTKGFINEHLTYTHGMGLTLSPSNAVTPEGLPVLFVKDLPPASSVGVQITRPEIYYGELSNDFVLAPTAQKEFDYPAGEGESAVYSTYDGRGGVPVASFARRLLYALEFGSLNILLSRDFTPRTRILYNRSVLDRAQRALPFLAFDGDPYMVIAADGRLAWMLDGYTTSDRYPYSEPVGDGVNYMRNSVKVVIDAYDGTVRAYVAAPGDPIIRTLARIYPGLLQSLASMPADLRAHLRYPEDLFRAQTALFAVYHMADPETFYHREDQWQIPGAAPMDATAAARRAREGDDPSVAAERRAGGDAFIRHMVMRLPGERAAEFILMRPFTPRQKDNLSAWMVARNDGANYGKLVVYQFPRQSLVFGPNQIANRINQDTEVSRQISLWDQRGSEVLRGELLVLPIEGSLVYVQPLYLRAEGGRIPELKRVVVAHEGRVAMAETLDAALVALFGETSRGTGPESRAVAATGPAAATGPVAGTDTAIASLAREAVDHYDRARAAQRADDWTTYGAEMRALGDVLRRLQAARASTGKTN